MIESILSLICWVWLPALLVSLHHSVWRQQSRLLWMNWVSARGWEMALIPLWCHSRDNEKRGSFMRPPIHSSVFLSCSLRCAHSPLLLSCDGFILQAGDSSPHSAHPPEMLPCYLPQPYPALPSPACSSPTDFGPSHKNPNFTPTLWRTGGEDC